MGDFKILVIKCGASGDVIRTTSMLKGLKQKYDNPKITWITSSFNYDLIKYNNLINRKVVFNESLKNTLIEEFDLVISLDDESEQCKLASSVQTKELVGAFVNEDNGITYTQNAEQWFGMGLLRPKEKGGKEKADQLKKENTKTYQQHLSEILDIQTSKPILKYSDREELLAKKFAEMHKLKTDNLIIGLNTGAGRRWKYKKLTEEKTAELADTLINELHAQVVLFGGPKERERNNKIKRLTKNKLIETGCNNTFLEFAALLDLCDIIISSDSLVMHMAIALKKNVIPFFGPTPASEIELFGRGKKIVGNVPCIVCYLPNCDVRPTCMDTITVNEIINAAKELIPKK